MINIIMTTTLRDYRHAHQFYTTYNHLFAPKVKFLYHIVFTLNQGIPAPNTNNFIKQIGVLAKRVDLPQYRAEIVTKQQYNRKKNIQTRIDYNDVNMVFHDDMLGATRAMFQEYYNYYFRDGKKQNNLGDVQDYDPRDKYSEKVPRYGLDNQSNLPFFKEIRIYQLSHRKWFSYTLVNPIANQWSHDTLEYGDGAGIMENTMTINYESVLYSNGRNNEYNEPKGFTDSETLYDNTSSFIFPPMQVS